MRLIAVGTVAGICRFPVKSMATEWVNETSLGWQGLLGDRRYAFVRTGDTSGFPWLTARQLPDLLRYVPRLSDPSDPKRSPIQVTTPDGIELALEGEELREQLAMAYGAPVHLVQSGRGTFDSAYLSLISQSTIDALGVLAGLPLDPRRFRQNILIQTFATEPYPEEAWLDQQLLFGDDPDAARIRLNRRDPRCMMVNLHPDEAVQEPAVLRAIAGSREGCAGIYASPEVLGTIRLGDTVYLQAASVTTAGSSNHG